MVMRIDRGGDRLVGDRSDCLHDVVVHTLERVEEQHTTLTDMNGVKADIASHLLDLLFRSVIIGWRSG